ncbi:DUF4426 domain-containing protein [Halomonas sp. McH1-25]|uniref:DUF4426 domain-containing protein n=1 Tax=unclassified Halomonas TaxID=2609666 RepID=UPI001EF7035E|nr:MULTISPECIES: DUF4426 domain-containing protein [unclassified Halomonas]MCG7599421.1 DUF4426 domain-containing protein [Halomonas sp. McH1-25]MCP1344274.1 DUF4426 domain-containing protein [Halomonas sp. FL8]MCP1362837.1 DUF4426 domain-containing protein [Halomonas sp. BBD45]MCP1366080.1 DUF4426 domain-containing protein [Halomonas sp. BBD48]
MKRVSTPSPMARLIGLTLLWLLASVAQAEQVEHVGRYQIHYSAVNTSFLTPEVAAAYDIQRSKRTALLNVSVLKTQPDGSSQPVAATVEGRVGNLAGQSQPLSFRTIREEGSIYQLAVFPIQRGEPMRFNLDVHYDRDKAPAEVAFIQRFFVD